MVTVRLPAPLRAQTDGRAELAAAPGTVREVLAEVTAAHPGLGERLLAADGRLQRFVNVFVGEDDVREVHGLDTVVAEGEVVTIVPAVAGGAAPSTPCDRARPAGWVTARPAHGAHWSKGRVLLR